MHVGIDHCFHGSLETPDAAVAPYVPANHHRGGCRLSAYTDDNGHTNHGVGCAREESITQ